MPRFSKPKSAFRPVSGDFLTILNLSNLSALNIWQIVRGHRKIGIFRFYSVARLMRRSIFMRYNGSTTSAIDSVWFQLPGFGLDSISSDDCKMSDCFVCHVLLSFIVQSCWFMDFDDCPQSLMNRFLSSICWLRPAADWINWSSQHSLLAHQNLFLEVVWSNKFLNWWWFELD